MALSEQQKVAIMDHLKAKLKGGCPLCGEKNWSVESDLHFHGVMDAEYRQPIEGKALPMVSILCTNCMATFQFQAVRLGLLK